MTAAALLQVVKCCCHDCLTACQGAPSADATATLSGDCVPGGTCQTLMEGDYAGVAYSLIDGIHSWVWERGLARIAISCDGTRWFAQAILIPANCHFVADPIEQLACVDGELTGTFVLDGLDATNNCEGVEMTVVLNGELP